MNRLSLEKRCMVLNLLVEGNSLQSISRITGVNINTVMKLLVDLGTAAKSYQDATLTNLTCKRIELDEIWSFCYSRRYTATKEEKKKLNRGDIWTWVAFDPDTRLVTTWLCGKRDLNTCYEFVFDVANRLANRVQVTSDGWKSYREAVEEAFDYKVDYAMLVKIFKGEKTDPQTLRLFDKPGFHKFGLIGNPDKNKISTSLIERQNLTMRQSIRRFTRRTNAFSKKYENHCHAVALHFLWYNFGRIHSSLKTTPAIAAGISDHAWSLEEIIGLIDREFIDMTHDSRTRIAN